jgi:hypothetical protein
MSPSSSGNGVEAGLSSLLGGVSAGVLGWVGTQAVSNVIKNTILTMNAKDFFIVHSSF